MPDVHPRRFAGWAGPPPALRRRPHRRPFHYPRARLTFHEPPTSHAMPTSHDIPYFCARGSGIQRARRFAARLNRALRAREESPPSQSRCLRRSRPPRRARQRSFAPSLGTVSPAHDGRLATFARLRSITAIGFTARRCGSHPSPSLPLRSGSQTCRDCRCKHSCASPVGRALRCAPS